MAAAARPSNMNIWANRLGRMYRIEDERKARNEKIRRDALARGNFSFESLFEEDYNNFSSGKFKNKKKSGTKKHTLGAKKGGGKRKTRRRSLHKRR